MQLQTSAATAAAPRVPHRLPCTIHYDGPARTARAFCPLPEPLTSFRGRALRPGPLQIPESSTMVVVEECRGEAQQSNDGRKEARVKYPLSNDGYFYLHDDPPDENSPVPRALSWISMANALHAPIQSSEE